MDKNTEDDREKFQRKFCSCGSTKTTILILAWVLNLTILGCLVAAHLYQKNELQELRKTNAKAIDDCMQRVALINAKLHQDQVLENRRDNEFTQQSNTSKSPGNIKRVKERRKVSPQQLTARSQTRCPYHHSRKRRKLCSFIAQEVSRQLNWTELRQEIKKILASEDRPQSAYFNFLGKNQDVRNQLGSSGIINGMYPIKWKPFRTCSNPTEALLKKSDGLQLCRLSRLTRPALLYSLSNGIITVRVAGMYFVYSQLTFIVDKKDPNNTAHLVSKATILMTKTSGVSGLEEHVEVISQVPVLTKQGNKPAITVSMFTQAYLYSGSKVRVTVTLRDRLEISQEGKRLRAHFGPKKDETYNVFGMYLLEKKGDSH